MLEALSHSCWDEIHIRGQNEPEENIIGRILLEMGSDMPDRSIIRARDSINFGPLGRWHIKSFRWCPALALGM
jgi:hypothetical protein